MFTVVVRKRRSRKLKPEELLQKRIANYIKINYPYIPFRFDLHADMPLTIGLAKKNKELHGDWTKGYPDLFLCDCKRNKKGRIKYGGLYLELKAGKSIPNTEHTRRQSIYHALLRERGYKVSFCLNYDECVDLIDSYLK